MNIWKILEIDETKDKSAIQAAYRAKLVKTHPEDDPEGFMELRAAFEEAMKLADKEDEPEAGKGADEHPWGNGPLGRWMEKLDDIYMHFSKRKDPEQWKILLQDEACINLDTKIQARTELLKYFMEHYFVSQEVMILLDQHFGFTENMDELSEEFPRNYLDVIITQGLQREEYPPYRYLTGDDSCDFDEYLRTGIRLSQCIASGDTKKGFEAAEEMRAMGIDNPFMEIDYAKVLCQAERYDEASFWLEEVVEEFPEIDDVHLMMGDVMFFMGDYDGAMEKYEMVAEKEDAQDWAKQGKAKCLMKAGKYKEANEIFCKLMEDNPYDADTGEWLRECNNQHIKQLKSQLEISGDEFKDAGDGDQSLLMDLGWCFFQNEEYDQALALMKYVEPEDEHKIGYESLVGRSALFSDRIMKAIKHLQNWEKLLHELDLSDEKNVEKKKTQMPFCLLLQSYAWDKKHDNTRAMETVEKALEADPEDTEAIVHKGQLLSKMWYMDDAVECFSRAIELKPDQHTAYVMRGRALYYMGYYSDGYDDCERALERFPFELAAYVFKVKILLEVGHFDMADEILAYLEGENVTGSELDFLKGFTLEARGEKEEAYAIFEKIIEYESAEKKERGEMEIFYVQNLAETYHHMAVLKYGTPGTTYSQVEELIEKGLEADPRYVYLLEMKAELAAERKQYKKALEAYEKVEDASPGRVGIYGAIDNLLRELKQWDRALEYAEKQLIQLPTGYNYMRRGQLFAYMNRNDDAEADFKKAIHLAPDLPYPYNYMGVLEESYERYDEALELYEKAIEIGERESDICVEAYFNAANLKCRKGMFDSAMMTLARGYNLSGDEKLLYEQMVVARRGGDFDDAEEYLKEYHLKKNDSESAVKFMLEMANITRERGEYDKALKLYEPLMKHSAEAGLQAGKIHLYNGNYREAVECIRASIDVYVIENKEPETEFLVSEYYLWAAKAALEGGFVEMAEQFADEGLTAIPHDYEKLDTCLPMVHQMIGGHYVILGEYDKAEEFIRKALTERKCDYCVHGYCIDACFEMIYLCLLTGRREEALEYLAKGIAADPVDTDFRNFREQIEMGKR